MLVSLSSRYYVHFSDFVRLHQGFSPPHWKRTGADRWDAGYEKTAYFLDWIENRYGEGTIRELNGWMKGRKYHRHVFKELTGRPVDKLWSAYCKSLEEPNGSAIVQQVLD